jgi:hypothetical protein
VASFGHSIAEQAPNIAVDQMSVTLRSDLAAARVANGMTG